MMEPANANPTTQDSIKRVGGTTSALAQWPEEEGDAEDDKFGKLEAMIKKAMDTMTAAKSTKKKQSGIENMPPIVSEPHALRLWNHLWGELGRQLRRNAHDWVSSDC